MGALCLFVRVRIPERGERKKRARGKKKCACFTRCTFFLVLLSASMSRMMWPSSFPLLCVVYEGTLSFLTRTLHVLESVLSTLAFF